MLHSKIIIDDIIEASIDNTVDAMSCRSGNQSKIIIRYGDCSEVSEIIRCFQWHKVTFEVPDNHSNILYIKKVDKYIEDSETVTLKCTIDSGRKYVIKFHKAREEGVRR